MKIITRRLTRAIEETHKYFPILYLGGPRQSGKTTLLRQLYPTLPYTNLEDPDTRRFAQDDPRRFLAGYPDGAILDEAQRVPELFSYLQGWVDNRKEVKFVLSGSQNFLLMERITQSLAGRVGILTLLPFDSGELSIQVDDSLESFTWRGGYPPLFDRNIPAKLFFDNYVQTYLERDVREIRQVGSLTQFHRFLLLCAARAGQQLNFSSLASDAGISPNTAKSWLSILEASWITFLLPPYYRNFNKRLTKASKLYFYDTGLLAYLLGVDSPENLHTHFAYGAMVENAVVVELLKQRVHRGIRPACYYFRDSLGREVDLLIEEEGKLKAIEIKASHTPHPEMTKNLRYWQELTGTPATDSHVIYGGATRIQTAWSDILPWREAMAQGLLG